jgi:hypothetical protein
MRLMNDERKSESGQPEAGRSSDAQSGAEPQAQPDAPVQTSAKSDAGAESATGSTPLSRLERLDAVREEHRRKVRTRLWYAVIPVVLAILLAVALLSVFGGLNSNEPAVSTTTTLAPKPDAGSGLLFIEQDDVLALAVLLEPREKGGVVLAVPGITLLKSGSAFMTLADLYEAGQAEAAEAALSEALAVLVGPFASVEWTALRAAMVSAGVTEPPAEALTGQEGEADLVAQALLAFVEADSSDGGAAVWDALALQGDGPGLRDAVGIDATSISTSAWTAAALTGTVVEGDGFTYLEPAVDDAQALLAASSAAAMVSVEVQDGAGVSGAAESAGDLLESAGYKLLPMSYSADFPNVELTRIVAASGLAESAEQLRALLGTGEIAEDGTLEANHIIVVLGKDFVAPSPPETEPTG